MAGSSKDECISCPAALAVIGTHGSTWLTLLQLLLSLPFHAQWLLLPHLAEHVVEVGVVGLVEEAAMLHLLHSHALPEMQV